MSDSVSWKNKVNVTNTKTLSETDLAGRMQVRSKMKNECDFFFLDEGRVYDNNFISVTVMYL